jgi:hypothetical protein
VTSYALAANPRCGVFVLTSDRTDDIEFLAQSPRGGWLRSPFGARGHVVAATTASSTVYVLVHDESGLRYLTTNNVSELIDANGLERGDIVVDAMGTVHVVYVAVAGTIGELRYAVRRDGIWSTERIDAQPSFEPSVALDRDGKAVVAYQYVSSPSVHDCMLATRTGSAWSLRDLSRLDDHWSASPCTCRTSRDGAVHVAFGAYRADGYVLRHAFGTPDALRFETIDRLASFGTDPQAAAVDPSGALHVAYRALDSSMPLKMGVGRGGEPPSLESIPGGESSGGVRVAIDGAGVTHVLFVQKGRLVYASRARD